jgi:hypothetical protein
MPQVERHVALGLLAFPAKQVAGTKQPAYKGWQSKRWDLGMLEQELHTVPYYGLTQPRENSRRLVILDLDDGGAGLQPGEVPWQERWRRLGEIGEIPRTKVTATPSDGAHAWFIWPDEVDLPRATWHGFTVRKLVGAKNWAAGPGSVRPDGRVYRDAYPERPIATMPVDLARSGQPVRAVSARAAAEPDAVLTGHDEIMALAGRLRFAGASGSDIATALRARLADGRIEASDPAWPWSEQDLDVIARDAGNMTPGSWTAPIVIRGMGLAPAREEPPSVQDLDANWAGIRSLDAIDRSPAAPLFVNRLDPTGHTIVHGTGGSGKGTLATWWTAQLVQAGHRVLILDYEHHPEEWARRYHGLAGVAGVENVLHVSPLAPSFRGVHGPIWQRADMLAGLVVEHEITYVIVDSIVTACGGADPLEPGTPARYAAALQELNAPVLSLAHVTKADDMRYRSGPSSGTTSRGSRGRCPRMASSGS